MASQDSYGGYMVAFAGRKYAARSSAAFVANSTYTVTSFTLVRHPYQFSFFLLKKIKRVRKTGKNRQQILPLLFHIKANVNLSMQVLEFKKGRLQNFYWKRDGCASCSGNSVFVCLNKQDCAIKTNDCKNKGGKVDCSVGIQLAFSGTDKHDSVFNSWYEVENLRQYSLYNLYSNLKNSLTSQYNKYV